MTDCPNSPRECEKCGLDNLSRHLRPHPELEAEGDGRTKRPPQRARRVKRASQMPSHCPFDNVLRHLKTNLTQHLAQFTSSLCEKWGLRTHTYFFCFFFLFLFFGRVFPCEPLKIFPCFDLRSPLPIRCYLHKNFVTGNTVIQAKRLDFQDTFEQFL